MEGGMQSRKDRVSEGTEEGGDAVNQYFVLISEPLARPPRHSDAGQAAGVYRSRLLACIGAVCRSDFGAYVSSTGRSKHQRAAQDRSLHIVAAPNTLWPHAGRHI